MLLVIGFVRISLILVNILIYTLSFEFCYTLLLSFSLFSILLFKRIGEGDENRHSVSKYPCLETESQNFGPVTQGTVG